jgi:transcriptional regulator NrdR family protein
MPEQLVVKCPSCGREIQAEDENALVSGLQRHLGDDHDLEVPAERVRENVVAQLRDFDGYNARPISGA